MTKFRQNIEQIGDEMTQPHKPNGYKVKQLLDDSIMALADNRNELMAVAYKLENADQIKTLMRVVEAKHEVVRNLREVKQILEALDE